MEYQTKSVRCLGINPGVANCGWSVVARNRSGKFVLMDSGCIQTASSRDEGARLLHIYQQITELLNVHVPNCVAIERVFHNKNISSSLTTAQVIGVIVLASQQAGIATERFIPQQVKAAVCGHGGVQKAIVKRFVCRRTGVSVRNGPACDAAATAIAGLLHTGGLWARVGCHLRFPIPETRFLRER